MIIGVLLKYEVKIRQILMVYGDDYEMMLQIGDEYIIDLPDSDHALNDIMCLVSWNGIQFCKNLQNE